MGKCPSCERLLKSVRIDAVTATYPGGSSFNALAYCCMSCSTIISIQIDPIAVKTDIVNAILKKQ